MSSIFVNRIPYHYTEEDLEKLATDCGVTPIKVAIVRTQGKSTGHGFITVEHADAEKLISELNGKEVDSHKLIVEFARPRRTFIRRDFRNVERPVTKFIPLTLYIGGLPASFTEPSLDDVFEGFKLESAELVKDRNGKCKGFGFVKFYDEETMNQALSEVAGTKVDQKVITLSRAYETIPPKPFSYRPLIRRPMRPAKQYFFHKKPREPFSRRKKMPDTVYVGNLDYRVGQKQLEEKFAAFNPKEVIVMETRTGKRLGYGFVTLGSPELAEKALSLNKSFLNGRSINVSIAYEKSQEN